MSKTEKDKKGRQLNVEVHSILEHLTGTMDDAAEIGAILTNALASFSAGIGVTKEQVIKCFEKTYDKYSIEFKKYRESQND